MNRATYYAPLPLGFLGTLLLHNWIADATPAFLAARPWVFVGAVALAVGGTCQVLMLAAQGILAQVLPAPGGRSIRGRAAATAGGLLAATVVLAITAALMRTEGLVSPAWATAGLAVGCAVAGALTYAWSWPAAVRDFGEDEATRA